MCVSYSANLGEVCTNYTCSLHKLQLQSVQTTAEVSRKYYVLTKFKCAYLLKCLRVLIIVSACTHDNEYVVLIETIALCGTRCIVIDIQVPSFT